MEQLKVVAIGAEIPRVKSIKKPETLRAKIIEKLADGKILPAPAASPKKRKAETEAEPETETKTRRSRRRRN